MDDLLSWSLLLFSPLLFSLSLSHSPFSLTVPTIYTTRIAIGTFDLYGVYKGHLWTSINYAKERLVREMCVREKVSEREAPDIGR